MARITAGLGNNNQQVAQGRETPPSVAFLFLLIIAEYAAFVILRYVFRNVHGG